MPLETITPQETLNLLKAGHPGAWIDVRSEVEFKDGSLPSFENAPILTQAERHEVGTTYKRQGQDVAIALGFRLTAPHRESRTQNWISRIMSSGASEGIVTCWRGGLRSQIATQWIQSAIPSGGRVRRVAGGYKELRRLLVEQFQSHNPIIVIGGNTGSGKTRFLNSIKSSFAALDLEGFAQHRGSSFGKIWNQAQPSQSTFENLLGLSLWGEQRELLVEDESVCIGSVHIPQSFWQRMRQSPLLLLKTPLEERVRMLYEEYVLEPLNHGKSPDELRLGLERDLLALSRRLGGLRTDRLLSSLRRAMDTNAESDHGIWIEGLLKDYYDPMYEYGRSKFVRPVLFEGSAQACLEFLKDRARRGMSSS